MAEEKESYKGRHTAHEAFVEALNRICRTTKKDTVTPEEILVVDNEVRVEWEMPQISEYPVFEKEWKPSIKKMFFQKLTGAKIIRKEDELPKILATFVETEGFDPAEHPEETEKKVREWIKNNFPGLLHITPEIRKAATLAVASIEQRSRSKEIVPEPEAEPVKKGKK